MTYALLKYGPAHRGMVARAIVHIVRYARPVVLAKIPAPWSWVASMVLHAVEREAERHIAGSAALLHPAHVYESAGVVLSDQETEDAVVARLPRIVRLPARYAVRHVLRVLAEEAMREAGRMREEQTT
jgi:hypothetical protein